MTIDMAEVQAPMALSLDTTKVEWKDDVELEVKEQAGGSGAWDDIW